MRTLGAITIKIFPFITVTLDCICKHLFGLSNLHPDLGKIGQLHGRAMLVNQALEIDSVKLKIIVTDLKTFLRKIEGLFHQVGIGIVVERLFQFSVNLKI
jgi:hypothetical protein